MLGSRGWEGVVSELSNEQLQEILDQQMPGWSALPKGGVDAYRIHRRPEAVTYGDAVRKAFLQVRDATLASTGADRSDAGHAVAANRDDAAAENADDEHVTMIRAVPKEEPTTPSDAPRMPPKTVVISETKKRIIGAQD